MTDKEKRELKDGVISIFKRFNILDHTATIGGLRDDILRYIDSLQEEPVSEVLEDAADKYSQSIHSDYFNGMFDSHNIYDAVIYGAKWGKHQAEVETQAQSMALAHGCPKEFITKDLENAAFDYAEDCKYDGVEKLLCVEHFKAGAQWQKQQDSKLPKVWDRETLDEYAYQVAYDLSNDWMRETPAWDDMETAVKLGAQWQKVKSIVDVCYHLKIRLPKYLDYNGVRIERKDFIEDIKKTLKED